MTPADGGTPITPTRRRGLPRPPTRRRRAAQILRAKPIELRYRVGRLVGTAFATGMREFKTAEAAERAVKEIADERMGSSIEQVGLLLWMPAEEATAMIEKLFSEGWEFD